MSRGDRCEPIFHDDPDREQFLATLGEAGQKAAWEVHAFCLMPNHFHLVVETPQGNLVAGMQWLLDTYTGRFNRRHKLCGHLFSGRYKALIVDGSADGYLKTVCDYVHLNPARARLLTAEEPLRVYRWSSFQEYLKRASRRVAWLRVERLFGEYRVPRDSAAGRRVFEGAVDVRRGQEEGEVFKGVRRGWCLGGEQFRQKLLAQVDRQLGALHFGVERTESQAARAERLVQEELQRLRWTEADLVERRKGDPDKVRLAQRLREETLVTLAWIAGRLQMGSVAYLNNRLYLLRKGTLKWVIIGPDTFSNHLWCDAPQMVILFDQLLCDERAFHAEELAAEHLGWVMSDLFVKLKAEGILTTADTEGIVRKAKEPPARLRIPQVDSYYAVHVQQQLGIPIFDWEGKLAKTAGTLAPSTTRPNRQPPKAALKLTYLWSIIVRVPVASSINF